MGAQQGGGASAVMTDVGASLVANLDPGASLAEFAAKAGAALDATAVEIWTFAETGDIAVREALWERDDDDDAFAVVAAIELDELPDLRALLEGKSLVERRAGVDLEPEGDELAYGASRVAAVALRAGDETIGVLRVAEAGPTKKLTAAEKRRLKSIADLAAAAVRIAILTRRGDEAAERARSLCAASRALATLTEPDETVVAITAQIAALLGGGDCRVAVYLRNDAGKYMAFPPRETPEVSGNGSEAEHPNALERQALEERRTVSLTAGRGARLASPLMLRGAPLGFISAIAPVPRPFTDDQIEDVEALAEQIALTLDIARLRRSVQRLTTTDTLTGLKNREFLYERLAAEIARANRYSEPLSLVIVDLDDFREFNERCGNREGNRLLRAVATLIRSSIRDTVDVACRYGGEEFAVMLPNTATTAANAGVVAERLRLAIETTEFRDENDELLGRITASAGVAGFPLHADDADDLIAAALSALRAAKSAGKNRVGLYSVRT